MLFVPRLVNLLVILVLIAELIATEFGMTSPDHLLVASTLSGLLTMISIKLSREALLHINSQQEAAAKAEQDSSGEC